MSKIHDFHHNLNVEMLEKINNKTPQPKHPVLSEYFSDTIF